MSHSSTSVKMNSFAVSWGILNHLQSTKEPIPIPINLSNQNPFSVVSVVERLLCDRARDNRILNFLRLCTDSLKFKCFVANRCNHSGYRRQCKIAIDRYKWSTTHIRHYANQRNILVRLDGVSETSWKVKIRC